MAGQDEAVTADTKKPVSVLFVCLGNICRSPMAEAVFHHLTTTSPLIATTDSCGTAAYHTGDSPDPRTMSTLADNGITTYRHRARKVELSDFTTFDYIFAMDAENLRNLETLKRQVARRGKHDGGELAEVRMWGEFGGKMTKGKVAKGEEVIDPYYGSNDGFSVAYEQMVRFSNNFMEYLENKE